MCGSRGPGNRAGVVLDLPSRFEVRASFNTAAEAYRRAFYSGAATDGRCDVTFATREYFEVLRFLAFMTLG